jgi:hypothetical protein
MAEELSAPTFLSVFHSVFQMGRVGADRFKFGRSNGLDVPQVGQFNGLDESD